MFITTRRGLVLGVIGGLTLLAGLALPTLETESSPENLIISFGGYEDRVAAFHQHFGDTDNIIVLLVGADDATSREALAYQHRLATHFRGMPEVFRVDGLTVTALPRAPGSNSAGSDSLDDLDALEATPTPTDPEAEAALETLIASAPDRFPLGLLSIAGRVTDADTRPMIEGDEVDEEEASTVRAAIAESPLVVGQLVSEDRHLAAVVVRLHEDLGTGNERMAFLDTMDAWLDANAPPAGFSLHRAGLPHLRTAIARYMIRDQLVLIPLTIFVCVFLLYLSFRWLAGTVIPLVIVGISVVLVLGGMAIFGEKMTILSNIIPTLLIIIALADSIHIISRWTEESRKIKDPMERARKALIAMAVPCFLTSFTTAIGLGSLVVSQTQMMRRFGAVAAMGTMVAYVITILVVPTLLTYLNPPKRNADLAKSGKTDLADRAITLGTRWMLRHPWTVLIVTALALIPMAWSATRVSVDTSLRDTFNEGDPVVVATQQMDEHMSGIRPLEILLSSDEEGRLADPAIVTEIASFERWSEAQAGVLRATSYTDYLLEAWARIAGFTRDEAGQRTGIDPRTLSLTEQRQVDALRALLARVEPDPSAFYLTPDARHAHVELRFADVGATRSSALIASVEEEAARRFTPLGLRVSITGEAYIGSRGIESVVQDLLSSLTLSVILIFFTLALLFRSPRLALLSVPPNMLPLVVTVSWMGIRGIPLTAATAIVFSLAIGVGVDSTIHGIARYLEEMKRSGNTSVALIRTARGTGRAVVISALSLVFGFAVLLLSSFVPIQHFGELIAAAMTASLFSTLIVQPVLVKLFAKAPKKTA